MGHALLGQLGVVPKPAGAALSGIAAQSAATAIGVALLAGLALLLLLLVAAAIRYRNPSNRHTLHSAMWFKVNELVCRVWYRWRRLGPCTVPRTGPVIITANHTCAADPLFLCAGCTYRKVAFLIAREYADFPVWRFFVQLIECIPVRRDGNDVAATKRALRRLHEGGTMGIFIEGRIPPPGEIVSPKDGVALLALRTGATVIPAYISGTKYRHDIVAAFLAWHCVRVRFGKPVDLSDLRGRSGRHVVAAATQRIAAAIRELAPAMRVPTVRR
ncbi:MAG TPA: lysophospholipid acyltransferase family protein [Phycisphaerae bacterium]|nr:lysophospholipid acyltransferase family protein [Phycisphaerae bacterium]